MLPQNICPALVLPSLFRINPLVMTTYSVGLEERAITMSPPHSQRVLLSAHKAADVEDLRRALEGAGYAVGWRALQSIETKGFDGHDLVMVDDGRNADQILETCGRLRSDLPETLVPLLFVTSDAATRLTALEGGADACVVRPFSDDELLAQVRALLRLKQAHDRMSKKRDDFDRANKLLYRAYQQIDDEMDLARRIQQSMLPQSLPILPPLRFAVHYRPCGRVGGDFYDAFRLDEDRVGFYVADVCGHGVPAALLTIFLKKAVQTKDIFGDDYRLVPPSEVLRRLNHEMIELALEENPFITMFYGLFDRRDASLCFARAGHPHPIYVPRSGEPELWRVHGTLLGVFETQFPVQTRSMNPGDKLLLYTDGIETGDEPENRRGLKRLVAAAAENRHLPVDEWVARLALELFSHDGQTDDLTLLGLEISAD